MQEDVINRREDARRHYKREGWCMRTSQKVGMVQEDVIKGTDDAGGYYNGEEWCMRKLQK